MRKQLIAAALAVFAAVFPITTAVHADPYFFTLTGPNSASFILDSSPTPDAHTGLDFSIDNVPGTFNGSPVVFTFIIFPAGAEGGGIFAPAPPFGGLNLFGETLFTGITTSNPTFKLGTFTLSDNDEFVPGHLYTLTITDTGAVPEPASWAMMLLGFGALGLLMRLGSQRRSMSSSPRLRGDDRLPSHRIVEECLAGFTSVVAITRRRNQRVRHTR